jgi:chromosome segregation ATPase
MIFKNKQEIKSEAHIRHDYQMTGFILAIGLIGSLACNLKQKIDNDYIHGCKNHYKQISKEQDNTIQQFCDDIGHLHDGNLDLRAALRDNQQQLVAANDQYNLDQNEIASLNEQIRNDQKLLTDQTNAHRQELAEARTNLNLQMTVIEQERDRIRTHDTQQARELAAVNEELKSANEHLAEMRQTLTNTQTECDRKLDDLSRRLVDMTVSRDSYKGGYEQAKAELAKRH